MDDARPENQINLQKPKTSKIYGITKMGANNTDQVVIKRLQNMGYDEFEIQRESGVHYTVVRSWMAHNDPKFVESDAPITAETAPLHAKIAELEAKLNGEENAEESEDSKPVDDEEY